MSLIDDHKKELTALTVRNHKLAPDVVIVTVPTREDGQSVVARYNRTHDVLRLTSLATELGVTKRDVRAVLLNVTKTGGLG